MPQPITPATLQGAFQNFSTRFEQGRKAMAPKMWWDQVAMRVPSTTEEEIYAWLQELPVVRKWRKGSPRKVNRIGANGYRLANEKFEDTIAVEREKIEDDKIGLYMPMFDSLGRQVAKFPDRQLATAIKANGTCFDGKAFFATDHPVDMNNADAGTYSNLFVGAGYALTETNFNDAFAAFATLKAENGEPMGLQPDKLMVPPQLRDKANKIVKASVVAVTQGSGAAAVTNTNQDLVKVVVVPELADVSHRWHLACTDLGVSPLIYQFREESGLVSRTREDDPAVFDMDEYIYGVRIRAAFGYGLPYLMAEYRTS
ncbi:MAG: Mu-like prophage major head subunit gpT family protein [Myxococcales bacterium]|nr:Mu-like prophage major head subunit gpT family protein [Myxococcales bacterium]